MKKKLAWVILLGIISMAARAEVKQPSEALALNIEATALFRMDDTYLAVNNSTGLVWFDKSGNSLASLKKPVELLDWRRVNHKNDNSNASTQIVLATVLLPEQQPALFSLDKRTRKFHELARLPVPSFKIDNLCLSLDPANNLSIFLLDERGSAEHWLVVDASGKPAIKKMRTLSVPPNSKSCSVDDLRELLFLAEESIGIWQFSASVEAAPGRKMVDVVKPFGQLSKSVEIVAVIPGGVAALDPDQKNILLYRAINNEYRLEKMQRTPDVAELNHMSFHVDATRNEIVAVMVDDESTQSFQVPIPWQIDVLAKPAQSIVSVTANLQTETMARFGDAADDPAIWVNQKNPSASRIIGTNKQQGLFVYDLKGKQVQNFNTGRLNNVDVRYGVPVGKKQMDIAVATNRDDDSLAIYVIHSQTGELEFSGNVKTALRDIYGFCLYQSATKIYAIPNAKSGEFQQIELMASLDKKNQIEWKGKLVRRFFVKSQPEGCVADDKHQRLFIGEEDEALWTLRAEPTEKNIPELVLAAGDTLVADVEGVGIYHGRKHSYLVVSSQGNNSFVIMDALPPFKVRGRVRVDMDASNNIDGVSETDGLEVSSVNFGGDFNEGILVVQDGHKVMPEAPQNFKYIDWKKIRTALALQ
ncbi:MAG TPA: phytase [Cellvibrio sp.]|nr:phytase [Cellvibrio sp.]